MAILADEKTRLLVQGITGNQGSFHTKQMLEYGTRVVAGVTPLRGGGEVSGVPVYDTVEQAVARHGANASVIFVPPPGVRDAAFEAMDNGLKLVVIITEHVPLTDAMAISARAHQTGATVVGPNTFGLVSPGKCKIGILPNAVPKAGHVGLASRSGTLSYEVTANLSAAGLGQSTVVGMGGDRVVGLSFMDILRLFERDADTQAVVMIGEIGGSAEEEAAEYIKSMSKPVVAYIAGRAAPPGKRMGHAGAIIERGRGTYQSKVDALRAAGAVVVELPWQVPDRVQAALTARAAHG